MRERVSGLGTKALAVLVLLVAAWILLKVVISVATAIAWVAVVVMAIIAIGWALTRL